MTGPVQKEAGSPSSLRLVLTLAIAGLVSGVAIIGIYESTLPTITANKARELRAAVFKVLPGVSQMQALVHRDGTLVVTEPELGFELGQRSAVGQPDDTPRRELGD